MSVLKSSPERARKAKVLERFSGRVIDVSPGFTADESRIFITAIPLDGKKRMRFVCGKDTFEEAWGLSAGQLVELVFYRGIRPPQEDVLTPVTSRTKRLMVVHLERI